MLYVSLAQKLMNPKFSPMTFMTLPLATSVTFLGQTNSLSDLIRVPDEAQRSQLSYEMVIVNVGWVGELGGTIFFPFPFPAFQDSILSFP